MMQTGVVETIVYEIYMAGEVLTAKNVCRRA